MFSRHEGNYWKTGETHGCGEGSRKHTPLVSQKQRGLFGSELARRREGKEGRMSGITTAELESHLRESAGKKLPKTHKA